MVSQILAQSKQSPHEAQKQTFILFLAVLFLSLLLVSHSKPSSAQSSSAVEIGSGTVDNSKVDGRKWTRINFTPESTGQHTLRVNLDSSAEIRFSVFKVDGRSVKRIATTHSSASPTEWTGTLEQSSDYYMGLWSVSGSTNYSVTLEDTSLTLLSEPVDVTVYEGENASFSVKVSGAGSVEYQWYKGEALIADATTDTLTLEKVSLADNNTEYLVVITDSYGTMTYASASLSVNALPDPVTIDSPPADRSVTEGDTASFKVVASGNGKLSYQWFAGNSAIAGANSDIFSISEVSLADAEKSYSVRVSDDYGSVSSDAARLVVANRVDLPLSSVNVGQGTLDSKRKTGPSISRHDFDSLASTDHRVSLMWDGDADIRFRVFQASGKPVGTSVHGSSPLVWTGKLDADKKYYVSAWSSSGTANYTAIVEANIPITIEKQPADISVTEGEEAQFSVKAAGSGSMSYQWLADGSALQGETDDELSLPVTMLYEDGTKYSVEVSNGVDTVTSRTASLSVNELDVVDPSLSPITTAPLRTWNAAGEVYRLITVGDTLYVGGDFTHIYSQNGDVLSRHYIAAFNRHTGQPTDFAPTLNGDVRALALSPDEKTLYVGGSFQSVDGQNRSRVAAFNVDNGRLKSFSPPKLNRALRAIAVTDEHVYLGGLFTSVGNINKSYIAAFDPDSGALDNGFDASPDGSLKALVAGSEGLWIGGDFRKINGKSQRGLGLVNLNTGAYKTSDDTSAEVIDLAATDSQLFIAIGGPGGRAAAFNRSSRSEQWTIASDGNFQGVAVDDGEYVYFGGHYEIVEGNRNADRMTRHDKKTGKMDTSWLPIVNGVRSVNAVAVEKDGLYIGGDFTKVNRKEQEGFAIFSGLTK